MAISYIIGARGQCPVDDASPSYTSLSQPLVFYVPAGGGGAYSLTLDSATITVTGSAMTPLVDRTLGLGAGSYIITGIAIDPLTERALGLDAGEFLLTGTAINMLCEKILDLGTGTYILTGSEIDVLRDAILGLEVGAYIIVGKDVITVYSGGGAVLATMFFIHNF